MRKLLVVLMCAAALLTTATVSEAKIYVNISDGTNTLNAKGSTTVPFLKSHSSSLTTGFKLSQLSPLPANLASTADTTDTLTVLFCPTRPCTVFFPSGAATKQTGDTFKFDDIGSATSSQARVEKFDSGSTADRVSFKGVKITSLVAGKILTITYGNTAGDLRALTSAQAASYGLSASMSGSFKTPVDPVTQTTTRATACKAGTAATDMDDPTTEACVKLSIALNGGTPLNGQIGNTTTVSVPCNNSISVNPCGGGSWSTSGTFGSVADGGSISCPSSCSPAQESTLTARFNGLNEVLQMTASSNGSLGQVTEPNGGGEDSLLGLGTDIALPRWVTFSAAIDRCMAVPKTPSTNDSHNISDSNLPVSIEFWCGNLTPAGGAGVPLVSLADTALLPGAASTRFEASRQTLLVAPGTKFKDIKTMSFSYAQFVGTDTVDARLGPLLYADCHGGSTHLKIYLKSSQGANLGAAIVYLGNILNGDNGKSGCSGVEQIVGADIPGNPDARVDLSGLPGNLFAPCCETFAQATQGQAGNALVTKIAFISARPFSPPDDPDDKNFKVTFFDGSVNGFSALSSLMVATGFTKVPTEQLSTAGVSIVVTKLTGTNHLGTVKVIRSGNLSTAGNKYSANPNLTMSQIFAEVGASYIFSLCPSGVETGIDGHDITLDLDPVLYPDPNLAVLGICLGNQGKLSIAN